MVVSKMHWPRRSLLRNLIEGQGHRLRTGLSENRLGGRRQYVRGHDGRPGDDDLLCRIHMRV